METIAIMSGFSLFFGAVGAMVETSNSRLTGLAAALEFARVSIGYAASVMGILFAIGAVLIFAA